MKREFNYKNFLIVLSGPSGVGKTTIGKKILEKDHSLVYSISATTRKKRNNETHGKDYFFYTEDEFKAAAESGELLEWAKVHNNYYGTPKSFILDKFKENSNVLLDIDIQGANNLMKMFDQDVVSIFILPPSFKDLKERLLVRKTDDMKEIEKRLNNAKEEIKERKKYTYNVINDNLDTTIEKIVSIINTEKYKSERLIINEEVYNAY